ncbi:MAG: hypothetical protein LBF17_00095 [Mediterranea sp.]|jgi:hypothetical protein|nr:hypothetical protein [Mediterranea sp.]
MRKSIIGLTAMLFCLCIGSRAEGIGYFFDPSIRFDRAIPSPEAFLGYEIGTRATEHYRIVDYYEKLAALSDKAKLIEIGQTYEHRKLRVLIVSSAENIKKLDTYKAARQQVRSGGKPDTPLIVFLGSTVHGNETSGAEAALLSAYYFVAAENEEVKKELEEAVIFIDPVRNPDGQERFASWVNSNVSLYSDNTSPYDREHTEGYPRGRGNHYWFDLNRDWVTIVHPESKARVAHYQDWLPHAQVDHHEMGANSTLFFEPTDPEGNESRYVPKSNYKLNARFADTYSKAADKIGSFYYTKESFDNKNPNFGSTYPDYNGAVGILVEQGSSRGIRQDSENGPLSFAFTVRNQLVTSIATVDAAYANKGALLDLQQEFFGGKADKASKAFIVGDSYDRSRLEKFVNLLLAHRLEVYENPEDLTVGENKYEKGKSYLIPADQPNRALVGVIFDEAKDYTDPTKLGYGAGFSVVYSTGLTYNTVTGRKRGNRVESLPGQTLPAFGRSEYAYLTDYRDSRSQLLLFALLEKGIPVKAASQPFSIRTDEGVRDYSYGSLLIPVRSQNQTLTPDQLYTELRELSSRTGVEVVSVATGYNLKGVDLGSSAFRAVTPPKALVVTGGNISSTEAGEVWYLFDQKLHYPLTRVDTGTFPRTPLNRFNRIILAGGDYSFLGKQEIEALKGWVRNGGVLITINSASRWAINNGLTSAKLQRAGTDSIQRTPVSDFRRERIPTSIFETKIDLTHPLAFGLTSHKLPVLRESTLFLAPLRGTGAVSVYTDAPLLNGYLPEAAQNNLKGSASILSERQGSGSVVLFAEDPLFRGHWDATTRTLVNAVAFGGLSGGGYW